MPLQTLPPDQRAVVQLILQRERSYAQIAELLTISEDAVRARAHAGLAALAPDVELPGDRVAQVSDFLLGQQNGKPRQATRRLLRSSNGAREWAETVRAQLEGLGAALPELPVRAASPAPAAAEPEAAPEPEPEPEPAVEATPAPRPRPLRDQAPRTRTRPVGATQGAPGAVAASSRVGGAVLIGLVVIAIVAIVLWLFVFRDSDGDGEASSASPTPSATAAQPTPMGQLALRGTGAARGASGALAVYTQQKQLLFALQVSQMPPTPAGKKYALWLSGPGNRARWIGDIPKVGKSGVLQVQGPRQSDTAFTRDFAVYRQVLITLQTGTARKRPGPTLVRGTLPRG
jgi:hypothetical protein